MSTEQTQSVDSEASIESRLSAAFAAEETESPEAAPVEAAPEASEEPTTEVAEDESSDGLVDFQDDDGSVYKIPKKVYEATMRRDEFTRKTQDLAQQHRRAQEQAAMAADKLQYAEAREQLSAAVMEDVTQLRSIESQLKQYQDADWPALYEANPGQALRFQQVMRDLEKQITQKQQEINAKVQHVQQATQKHNQFQWEAAEKGARQMIGEISAADNAAMLRTVESLGITPKEFKERFADPRIIAAVHKAAKWDSLQSSKPQAVKTANQAPPVVKPGASKGPGAASQQKYKDVRSSLKKSGSVEDAARLFLLRGM